MLREAEEEAVSFVCIITEVFNSIQEHVEEKKFDLTDSVEVESVLDAPASKADSHGIVGLLNFVLNYVPQFLNGRYRLKK